MTDKRGASDEWRDIALQFDGQVTHEQIKDFLTAPPLSGDAVLAERAAAISAHKDARIAKLENMLRDLKNDPDYTAAYLAGAASTKALVAELVEALDRIKELNMSPADENGHRWEISDLIGQEIRFAKAKVTK